MKLIRVLAFVLSLALLGAPIIAIVPIVAPTYAAGASPVYYSVDPTPNAPMTNLNLTTYDGVQHGLTPGGYVTTPVTQYFNVSIDLRNATVANVESLTVQGIPYQFANATGVWAVEVHFDFSAITHASDGARVCTPIGFTNMIGQPGGVLIQNSTNKLQYALGPGFFDASGNPVNSPALATQYIVSAASSMGPWNGTVGTVATIEFEIMGAPATSLAQADFIQQMAITFADLQANIPPQQTLNFWILGLAVPFSIINGSLHIVATASQTYDSAAVAIISPLFKSSAALGYTCIVNATVSNAASVNAAFNVELILNSTGVVGSHYIPTGYIIGMAIVQNLAFSAQLNVSIVGYTSVVGGYCRNNVTIYTEPVLGEEPNTGNNGPITLPTQNFKTGYYVMITIPGDFNSDRKADLSDLTVLAKCYNAPTSGKPYNPNCDVKDEGHDGLTDLSLLAGHYNYPGGTDAGWTTFTG
jgi:hypothetical protein